MKRLFMTACAAAVGMVMVQPASAAMLIDDFSAADVMGPGQGVAHDPAPGIVLHPGGGGAGTYTNLTNDASILGGTRTTELNAASVSSEGNSPLITINGNDSSRFRYFQGGDDSRGAFKITWDGLSGTDLTQGGQFTGLLLTDVSWKSPVADLIMEVFSAGDDPLDLNNDFAKSSTSTFVLPLVAGEVTFNNEDIFYGFNSFSGNADFTNATAITLTLAASLPTGDPPLPADSAELVIAGGLYAATPEPSSIALLGMGAVSLLGYGWRRRRQSKLVA